MPMPCVFMSKIEEKNRPFFLLLYHFWSLSSSFFSRIILQTKSYLTFYGNENLQPKIDSMHVSSLSVFLSFSFTYFFIKKLSNTQDSSDLWILECESLTFSYRLTLQETKEGKTSKSNKNCRGKSLQQDFPLSCLHLQCSVIVNCVHTLHYISVEF